MIHLFALIIRFLNVTFLTVLVIRIVFFILIVLAVTVWLLVAVFFIRTIVFFIAAVGVRDMSGPIGIVNAMGEMGAQSESAGEAVRNILNFVAFIAINLAVMNLLPIPALDGGQILFLVVDGVWHRLTRRRINQKYLGYINMAGFCCLIGLMVVVAVSDVVKLF